MFTRARQLFRLLLLTEPETDFDSKGDFDGEIKYRDFVYV